MESAKSDETRHIIVIAADPPVRITLRQKPDLRGGTDIDDFIRELKQEGVNFSKARREIATRQAAAGGRLRLSLMGVYGTGVSGLMPMEFLCICVAVIVRWEKANPPYSLKVTITGPDLDKLEIEAPQETLEREIPAGHNLSGASAKLVRD